MKFQVGQTVYHETRDEPFAVVAYRMRPYRFTIECP